MNIFNFFQFSHRHGSQFREREKIRRQIAERVVQNLKESFGGDAEIVNPNDILKRIIKDLRGPYYKFYFSNQQEISAADFNAKETSLLEVNIFRVYQDRLQPYKGELDPKADPSSCPTPRVR